MPSTSSAPIRWTGRDGWLGLAIPAVAVLVSTMLLFSVQLGNGFRVLFGDSNDGIIGISILEHWNWSLAGAAHWDRTGYFYPHADSLGYNDALFLYGLPYALFRRLGIDPFLASEFVSMTVRAVGCLAAFIVARRIFEIGLLLSGLGAFLFNLAGNTVLEAGHAQLFTVSFLPVWLLLLDCAARAMAPSRPPGLAMAWSVAAALFLDVWLMTAFYTAWFSAVFVAVVAACAAGAMPFWSDRDRIASALLRRTTIIPLAVAGVAGIMGAIPFLLVYLPKAAETGMYRFEPIARNMPDPADLVNPHLSFGLATGLRHALSVGPALPGEVDRYGFSVLLLTPALLGALMVFRGDSTRAARVRRATVLATLIVLFAVTHPTAWVHVYAHVPGARALREVGRFLLILSLPLTLLAMCGLEALLRRRPGRARSRQAAAALLAIALASGLAADECRTARPVFLDRVAGLHLLRSVPAPPAGCVSFFVTGRSPEFRRGPSPIELIYRHNVDAMLISTVIGLPTVNGFSTFNPPDWAFADPDAPDYRIRIARYAAAHALSPDLCALDLDTKLWARHPMLP